MHDIRKALSDLVIQRSLFPRFEGVLAHIDHSGSAINPFCGDAVSVAISLDSSSSRLHAVRCSVDGCSVCKASADLMAESLQGVPIGEASQLDEAFQRLLHTGELSPMISQSLALFSALQQVPARAPCALLPWQAMRQALRDIDLSSVY